MSTVKATYNFFDAAYNYNEMADHLRLKQPCFIA